MGSRQKPKLPSIRILYLRSHFSEQGSCVETLVHRAPRTSGPPGTRVLSNSGTRFHSLSCTNFAQPNARSSIGLELPGQVALLEKLLSAECGAICKSICCCDQAR